MNRKLPDATMLDAILLGAEDADARDTWEELLATPDAAERWQEAVDRREHIDRFAAAIITAPWLARVLTRLRELHTSLAPHSTSAVEAVLAPELMARFLSPEARPATRLATPRRGEVEVVRLARGDILELRPTADWVGDFRVFYRSTQGEGELPRRRWRMEAGEAPVLLLCVAAPEARSLEGVLERSTLLGGVILLDAPQPWEEAPGEVS